MNYLLKQIVEICDDAPLPSEAGTLAQFQDRLDELDEALCRIHRLARELQKVLDGEHHMHVAGTLADPSGDTHIDVCAICGHDIRHEIHRGEAA